MATKEEVKNYLRNLKDKVGIFNIVFRNDRQKNSQTLLELEIQPDQRTRIITELQAIDYCEGPLEDTLNGLPDFWVFGKNIKGREIYIKISMGRENQSVICISFHFFEYPLVYPFKKR
ncbi:MAG: toxin [Rikenellaceae bacterium]|nr:toxin [Rikenellaceae bacterium]